ncbi:VRR-NUC domain-containing protein [Vibrio sp. ABG19]|uniref:VRR-NUC domain-containing protein n=1 Tax=Vibrio sp. ABG19 TaxID=2817385 RepID=UPI00249DC939|nr:VRR-NUC domain-containing protein [Vibrio sp. ABG19]
MTLAAALELQKLSKGGGSKRQGGYQNTGKRQVVYYERAEQTEVIVWASHTVINGIRVGDYLTHVPNEGKRGPQARKDFIELGGRSGYPDLIFDVPTPRYPGLRIEMKAPKDRQSYVTENQAECHIMLRSMGYRVEVCYGAEEAKAVISDYLSDLNEFS